MWIRTNGSYEYLHTEDRRAEFSRGTGTGRVAEEADVGHASFLMTGTVDDGDAKNPLAAVVMESRTW
jgi:hypothetical protein